MGKYLIFLTGFLISMSGAMSDSPAEVFPAQVSGMFYPGDSGVLSRMADDFVSKAEVPEIKGNIVALVSPHAGYRYSGAVAGFGFRAIKGRDYKTVIIVGPSHHRYFEGVSVYEKGTFQTPLGKVEIDSELAGALISRHEKIRFYRKAFVGEHSLETQIPFLQRTLRDFRIVPVLMADFSYANCKVLAEALQKTIGERDDILIVASSDMSHFHPYEKAVKIDRLTLDILEQFDPQLLWRKIAARDCELCGAGPVITTLLATKGRPGVKIRTLKYANSGDVTGERGRVVGYGSLVIYREKKEMMSGSEKDTSEEKSVLKKEDLPGSEKDTSEEKSVLKKEDEKMLNEKQRKKLLEITRSTIEEHLRTGKKIPLTETDPDLKQEQGAFVTLRRGGALRGCIGNLAASTPLYQTIQDMAIQASSGDPRFPAVTLSELKEITIEISVLSPLKKITDPGEIKLGEHGVLVRRGFSSGVFLPQVAEETGWSKEEFLSNLCSHKAGFPPDAWKSGDIDLYIFTAEVFDEEEVPGK